MNRSRRRPTSSWVRYSPLSRDSSPRFTASMKRLSSSKYCETTSWTNSSGLRPCRAADCASLASISGVKCTSMAPRVRETRTAGKRYSVLRMRRGLFLIALGCVAYGQSFEAISVRPAAPASDGRIRPSMRGGPGTGDPDRIIFTNVTLLNVVLRAYQVKSYQATAPDWMSSERYDITAKIPADATPEQFYLMLQGLLTEP